MNSIDTQKTWESRITSAKDQHKEWSEQFKVQLGRDYFEGKQNPGWPEDEWITVNKIYSHLKAQLPALYDVDPYFYVKLKRSYSPDPQAAAMFDEKGTARAAMLNYLKKELELKKKARLGIQDAHFAYGVIKTHVSVDEVENESAGLPMTDDDGNELIGPDGAPIMEPETLPANEKYHWSRVHPDDFIFDDDSGPLPEDWHWVAQRFKKTAAEVRADKRLNNKVLDSAPKGGEKEDRGGFANLFRRAKPDAKNVEREVITLWEIYDLDKNEWLIIAEGAEEPAKKPEPVPEGIEGHPFSVLRFTLRDKSAYPIPPVSQATDQQREINQSRSRIQTHRKRFNRKYEVFADALEDPEMELAKLETGGDGAIIRKKMPQQAIFAIQDAPLDQQTYQELGLLNRDLIETLGGSDNARGLTGADSATEAALVDKRLEVREGDDMAQVIDWVSDAAKKMDQLVQVHITRDEAVRITGPSGEETWQSVRSSDYDAIDGEYEYTVNTGATFPRLPQVERAQWLAFLQLLGSFPHLMTQQRLMKRMAEMHHIEDDAMLEDLAKLGQQIITGQVQGPGGGQTNPIAGVLGAAMGDQGGVTGGGGSEVSSAAL